MGKLDIYTIVSDAGMSTRPEFYSGRGVVCASSDVDGDILYKIYKSLKAYDENKANSFLEMVVDMRTLGATEFLLSLYALAKNDFVYDEKFLYENNTEIGNGDNLKRGTIGLVGGYGCNQPENSALNQTEAIKSRLYYKFDRLGEVPKILKKLKEKQMVSTWR